MSTNSNTYRKTKKYAQKTTGEYSIIVLCNQFGFRKMFLQWCITPMPFLLSDKIRTEIIQNLYYLNFNFTKGFSQLKTRF